MIGKVKESGIGYVVTNEGRFPIAASCSSRIVKEDDVIIVDGFVIASVSGTAYPVQKSIDINAKKFGAIFMRAVKGTFNLLTETVNIQAGKFLFNVSTTDGGGFVARISFGNIHIDATEEVFSLKYPGIFDIDITSSTFKIYLYRDVTINTKLLNCVTTMIQSTFNTAVVKGDFVSGTVPVVQLLIDSLTATMSNVSLKGINYILDYTGKMKASAATISLSSRDTTEINSSLGSVVISSAQGVAISATPGFAVPTLGMVTMDAPAIIKMNAPFVYLTAVPLFHTTNAEMVLQALAGLSAAIAALTPFTTSAAGAASAVSSALAPTVAALPLIPNYRVMQ